MCQTIKHHTNNLDHVQWTNDKQLTTDINGIPAMTDCHFSIAWITTAMSVANTPSSHHPNHNENDLAPTVMAHKCKI